MTTTPTITVVLKVPKGINASLAFFKGVTSSVAADARFAAITPAQTAVAALYTTASNAVTAARNKGTGLVQARKTAMNALHVAIKHWRDFVQQLVDADPVNGEAIALAAGMNVKKEPVHTATEPTVGPGAHSGDAIITVPAPKGDFSINWQYSLDKTTWLGTHTTMQHTTTFTGLTPGVLHYFRYQIVTRKLTSDWVSNLSRIVT